MQFEYNIVIKPCQVLLWVFKKKAPALFVGGTFNDRVLNNLIFGFLQSLEAFARP